MVSSRCCSVPARLLQVLLVMAAAGYGGRAEFSEKYHQLGEPGVVTVVTATTGKAELARCVESVRAQRYRGAIQHLVVVDGEEFAEAARAALATLEQPAALSPPALSPHAAATTEPLDAFALPRQDDRLCLGGNPQVREDAVEEEAVVSIEDQIGILQRSRKR